MGLHPSRAKEASEGTWYDAHSKAALPESHPAFLACDPGMDHLNRGYLLGETLF
jgi:hypothetical protein